MLDAKRRNEYAGLISASGHHLLAVVNGILDMSKIETDNFEITPEPFAPKTRGCRLLRSSGGCGRVRAGVSIEKTVADDLPEMIADKRALNQILLNLLSNAIRFTDRGGKIIVSARSDAAAIVFAVEDDGVGISDEDLARVGEPYFQARASYRRHGGTGLGLSIVKGLVRLHGGELNIRSRLGEGTRVTVRLPLDCERARPMKRQLQAVPTTATNQAVSNVAAYSTSAVTMRDRAVAARRNNGEEKCLTAAAIILERARIAGAAGPIGRRIWSKAARRPVDTFAILAACAASVVIIVNAVFLQSGSHPHHSSSTQRERLCLLRVATSLPRWPLRRPRSCQVRRIRLRLRRRPRRNHKPCRAP